MPQPTPSVPPNEVTVTSPHATGATVNAPSSSGRYLLHDEIARGGMGAIYLATDTALDREIAVKVLLDKYGPESGVARRFLDEARITGQLQHPGIPPVHDLGTLPDGRTFLAMKLIRGETLDTLLKQRTNPAQERGRFLAIFEQICHAVGYAHAHEVIHRDLKPANIMVGAFGEVQVMDWGLAKVLTSRATSEVPIEIKDIPDDADPNRTTAHQLANDSSADRTQAGQVMGTPAYMPPEQARGEIENVDRRSDVFALGGILCTILTGHPPFGGRDALRKAANADLEEVFARLDCCGAESEVIALCNRCLSPRHEERFTDAGEVARAVAELRAAAEERARQAELDRVRAEGERSKAEAEAKEQRKRRRVQWTLATVVLAARMGMGMGMGMGMVQWTLATVVLAALLVGGWIWQSQRQKREAARNELNATLQQSRDFMAKGNLTASLAAARQAEGLLGASGNEEQMKRDVSERLREIEFVGMLEKVRTPETSSADRSFSRARADGRYALAFRALDIDVDSMTTEEAARQIEARPALKPYLIEALDDWVGPRRQARADPSAIRGLLQVSQRVDPDPWRDRFREAAAKDDLAALLKLTDEVDVGKQTTSALLTLAGLLREHGQRNAAVALLRRAEWQHPEDFWLLFYQGHWHSYDSAPESMEEALRCYSVAVALRPHFVEAWSGYSLMLRKQGKADDALRAARRAVELAPGSFSAYLSLERALAMKGEHAAADEAHQHCVALLREHLRNDPEDDEAWTSLGIRLERQGDLAGALEAAREAVRIAPRNLWAWHNAGNLLRQQGKSKEALPWLEEAGRLAPDAAHILTSLALARADCGDGAGAEAALRQAIASQPHTLRTYEHLADLLRRRGDGPGSRATIQQAIQRCSEILQRFPNSDQTIVQLALNRRKLGETEEAARLFRHAVAINSSNIDAYVNLSLALAELGLLDEALAASRGGLRCGTPSVVLLNNLAFDLLEKGEPLDEATTAIDKALTLNPASDVATLTKAELLRAQGKFVESLAAYRQGHELHQKRGGTRWPTATWVKDAERLAQVDAELPAVLKGERKLTTAKEYQEFGELYAYRQQHTAAARFYRSAFSLNAPVNPSTYTQGAKSAALAGLGKSSDAPSTENEKERAEWRKQALGWLRECLPVLQKRGAGTPAQRKGVRTQLNQWRTHDAFLGVRDAKALELLPENERREWQQFWTEVGTVLAGLPM